MLKDFTLLYVEDETALSDIVVPFLKKIYTTIFIASNGEEGYALFLKHDIDLVITDINMPKIDGLQMSQMIREINKNIPIIITTAYNENHFLHEAIKIGISRFVTKPMNLISLVENIENVLQPIVLQRQLQKEQKEHLEQLVQSTKFSAIGQFAAGITHEINTPLTYIKANVQLMKYDIENMQEEKIQNELQHSIKKITDGIFRIENIINSMKEVSVQKSTRKQNVNIFATIITALTLTWNRSKHLCAITVNQKEFDLSFDKNSYTYLANVEAQRIEQVWIIIINNALDELVKLKDFKSRKLDISLKENENTLCVFFKDNAGGIAKEIYSHLFEAFKGTKDSSGMGVGLSIAKKIIDDQEDIEIDAYNENDGAVFKITFKKSKLQ